MQSIRKIAKTLAGLWIVFVIVMAVGGTLAFNSGGWLFGDAIDEETQTQGENSRESKAAQRAARAEARSLAKDGWGVQTMDDSGQDDGWAAP